MRIWLLVFMFNGQPAVSGPHTLEVCLAMARDQLQGRCWNLETMELRSRHKPHKRSGGPHGEGAKK